MLQAGAQRGTEAKEMAAMGGVVNAANSATALYIPRHLDVAG